GEGQTQVGWQDNEIEYGNGQQGGKDGRSEAGEPRAQQYGREEKYEGDRLERRQERPRGQGGEGESQRLTVSNDRVFTPAASPHATCSDLLSTRQAAECGR